MNKTKKARDVKRRDRLRLNFAYDIGPFSDDIVTAHVLDVCTTQMRRSVFEEEFKDTVRIIAHYGGDARTFYFDPDDSVTMS